MGGASMFNCIKHFKWQRNLGLDILWHSMAIQGESRAFTSGDAKRRRLGRHPRRGGRPGRVLPTKAKRQTERLALNKHVNRLKKRRRKTLLLPGMKSKNQFPRCPPPVHSRAPSA